MAIYGTKYRSVVRKGGVPRIILAGTHSGVGKTTITIGIIGALAKRGISVQPYKIGPDYIDTGFHKCIAGRPSRNLDSYFLERDILLELFSRQAKKVSFSVIEGVMGLYDGLASNSEIGSTAHVAKILKAPVILIIDAGKIAASVSALVLGYKMFDPDINVAGCILNRIKNNSHYQILKESIEKKCRIKVLGYLPKDNSLFLAERHLGLKPAGEVIPTGIYTKIRKAVERYIDIDAVFTIGNKASALPHFKPVIFTDKPARKDISIAVAMDKSFHFYYQDNLDILEHFGARLCFFSPLKDKYLPLGVSGIYIGGGFPEIFAKELADNKTLLTELKMKSREGMPIYAECGGLMYLMRELCTKDKRVFPMAGIFPGRTQMGKGLRMFGYYDVETECDTILGKQAITFRGHVFHWSYVTGMPADTTSAFRLKKGKHFYRDGYLKGNTVATYLHLHFGSNISVAKNFVESCRNYDSVPTFAKKH